MKAANFFAIVALLLMTLPTPGRASGPCNGHFPNPVTDICWNCFFPVTIAGAQLEPGYDDYNYPPPICTCPISAPPFVRIGIGMTYWSPDRAFEVVRTPMCSPILNGTVLGTIPASQGSQDSWQGKGKAKSSFYHVHWLQMPFLQELSLVSEGEMCLKEDGSMDYNDMSEIDPLWNDDELAFMVSPESILFDNMFAIAACAADSIKADATNFGIDTMFWCSGSHGQVYPLSGNEQYHKGGVNTAMNLAHRMAFTLHKTGLLWDTSTVAAMCQDIPQPIMRKGQYKVSFMLPYPTTARGYGFGVDTDMYEQGLEFPYAGEDWAAIVWRRHTCCVY